MSYTINTTYKAKYYGSQRTINKIKYIVVHYTANSGTTATAKSNANYFANIDRQASAHYVVDENPIIYQCVPDNYIAWSVGDNQKYTNGGANMKGIITNTNSISIEMVSHSNLNGYYIPENTINKTIELIKNLQNKYNISNDNIYMHWHVTGKLCPKPFIDDISKWNNFKQLLDIDESRINKAKSLADEISKKITISDKETLIKLLGEYYNGSIYWVIKKLLALDFTNKKPIDGTLDIYRRTLLAINISDKSSYNTELLKADKNSLFWVIYKLLNKLGIN